MTFDANVELCPVQEFDPDCEVVHHGQLNGWYSNVKDEFNPGVSCARRGANALAVNGGRGLSVPLINARVACWPHPPSANSPQSVSLFQPQAIFLRDESSA